MLMVDASIFWISSNFAPPHHLLKKLDITLVQTTAPSEGATIERFLKDLSSRAKSLLLKSRAFHKTLALSIRLGQS